jgi:antitoxin (DNA-binding transcriptional repressor) of toxin-antitoxin stability system
MTKMVITVTEAARNFADCVNRAHYQNVTFVLLKNGTPVARLVPDGVSGGRLCSGLKLAETLRGAGLSAGEAKAWRRDLHAARKKLKAPPDRSR